MFYYKNKNDKKKLHPSRCSCSDYRISHDCLYGRLCFCRRDARPGSGKVLRSDRFNKKTTGVFGRSVSYEGISLEGKTYDEAVSEINEYANDRLTRYMQLDDAWI